MAMYIKKEGGVAQVDRVSLGQLPDGFLLRPGRAGFYLDPDQSQARVGRVPGRPAGPIRVSKLCFFSLNLRSIIFFL